MIFTTYNIGISEIVCTNRYEDTEELNILYDAEASKRPNFCTNPMCGHLIKPHIHSSKTNIIKDIKSEGKIVVIRLKINRYRCPICKYVFPDEFTFYEKGEHLTKRLNQEFVNRCIDGETFRFIGNAYGVDGKTVAKAFNAYAKAHGDKPELTYTPIILGIDKSHIDDHYRLILTDIYNQKLIDIKKNNLKPTVIAYLKTLDKKICKCVTMDFFESYLSCVNKVLPDALVTIDKYHVIQEINCCINYIRKDLQNYYRSQGYDISIFNNSKRLFMTNWEDLSPEDVDKLRGCFKAFPQLYEAYMVKETLRDIYATARTYNEALNMFNAWLDAIPSLERFRTMKNAFAERKTHILNYWLYRWTNSFTELTNNTIKQIEKDGSGCNFDVLRDRCILSINNQNPDKFKYRDVSYVKGYNQTQFKEKMDSLYDIALMFDVTPSSIALKTEDEIETNGSSFPVSERDRMVNLVQRIACHFRDR